MLEHKITDRAGQRLDNYLFGVYKNTPQSHVYRMIRKGRIRINGKVCKQNAHRITLNDVIRMPTPVLNAHSVDPSEAIQQDVKEMIQEEHQDYWVINKAPGVCVHQGTNELFGVIEVMRYLYGDAHLIHRIDRNTSGCLLVAKNYVALTQFQDLWRSQEVKKRYLLLVEGRWSKDEQVVVDQPLLRVSSEGQLEKVIVSNAGKSARTIFTCLERYKDYSLLSADIETGRTHQIRVHAAHIGYPIVGDKRYGQSKNRFGIKMFLHARSLDFTWKDKHTMVVCDLTKEQQQCLDSLS